MNEDSIASSYDLVADAYARQFFRELDDKPLDRALLDVLVVEARGRRVVDLGCACGHAARYLHDRGAQALGIDLSARAIEVARRLSPEVSFEAASMLALPLPGASVAAAVALYAIVNLSRGDVSRAFAEVRRVLEPGAPFLLSFHLGDETLRVDELLGERVSMEFTLFPRPFVEAALQSAGFAVHMWMERRAYPAEHPTTRAYVLAR